MRSVNTVLIELCLLHYMIGWRNSTNHYKRVKLYDDFMTFAWTNDINVYLNCII